MRTIPFPGVVVLLILAAAVAGCAAHRPASLTLGAVQGSLHKGMTQPQVSDALGSPRIVSKDDKSREVWIYDCANGGRNKPVTLLITFEADGSDTRGKPLLKVADINYHSPVF